jgi:putative hydrolase of the HAD superfamily
LESPRSGAIIPARGSAEADDLKPIVIFDLAEVLNRGLPGMDRELGEIFSAAPEEVLPGLRGEIMDDYCRGKMTEDQLWRRSCAKNGWAGDIDAAKRVLRENMRVKIPGTEDLLRELVAAGHGAYLLSDHGREWIDYLLGVHDFFELFERLFWSFDLASIKRERVTFEKVLSELGNPDPAGVVFVDDAPANVETARSAGIDAVQFTDAEALRGELAKRRLP